MREIERLGYGDAAGFVADIVSNFNEIREGTGGRILLVECNGKALAAVVELSPASDGNAWRVITATTYRLPYLEKRRAL